MLTSYSAGQGGKHRDSRDARVWRQLSTNIRQTLERVYYQGDPAIARVSAEDHTRLTVRELNRIEASRTLGI